MSQCALLQTQVDGQEALVLRAPAGELEATFVPGAGMVGASLRHAGEELLGQRGGLSAYVERGSSFGIPFLYPWANRLGGFEYDAAGQHVELIDGNPLLHLDASGLPMHGLLGASPLWEVTAAGSDERCARLSARLNWTANARLMASYPFPHEVGLDVTLTAQRLRITAIVDPIGTGPVPIAFGFHPYLTLPGVARADWNVELPVRTRALVDERMIPTGEEQPADAPDGPLGERSFDDGYTELDPDPVFALAGGGRRIEVAFAEGYPCAQVYAPAGQDLICFEPMTAPTNALMSGSRLRVAQPGDCFRAVFEIRVGAV